MDLGDFSREFDMLWDNIMSDKAPGLTEYEKSVFLTQAQEALVYALYTGTSSDSFEETEQNAAMLVRLESQAVLTEQEEVPSEGHIVPESVFYRLPSDLMFRTYESVVQTVPSCGDMSAVVQPVTQDEFWKAYRDPFRGPTRARALRLSHDKAEDGGVADLSEVVARYGVKSYLVRYLRHPRPIVLEDLPEGLSIEGLTAATPCELDATLHRRIVSGAVSVAQSVWS